MLQRRGTLTIKQRKFGWLPFLPSPTLGSFLVGTFRSSEIAAPEPSAAAVSTDPP